MSELSPEERQRRTAAEIARKKVLAAYSRLPENAGQGSNAAASVSTEQGAGQDAAQNVAPAQNAAQNPAQSNTYKRVPIQQSVSGADWKKYHSAWQDYYQKYYSDYYSKAAKQYIQNEKLREARLRRDFDEENEPRPVQNVTASSSAVYSDQDAETEESIASTLKATIQKKATEEKRRKKRFKKFRPLIAGAVVMLVLLFLQYNRMIFAPIAAYVSPGNGTDTSISAIDPTISLPVGDENRLIIPKLNIEVPIVYGVPNDSDSTMEAMNEGVVHWVLPGASALPGQVGNMVITGHSAGDIYTSNPYKFIFSGLERLSEKDLIYIDYMGTRYTYSITKFETVEPTEVSKLIYDTEGKALITLITCTPLGTSRYRLLVTAEQISPSISGEVQEEVSEEINSMSEGEEMSGNEPTFFESVWNFLTGN